MGYYLAGALLMARLAVAAESSRCAMTSNKRAYLVYQYGAVWQMSLRAYRRMMRAGSKGQSFDLDDMPGCKLLGQVDAQQMVDWERDDFSGKLAELPSSAPVKLRCNCPLACALHDGMA